MQPHWQWSSKRTVALKLLSPALTGNSEACERFIHEAQAASELDHPNICTIYEFDETEDGQMYIAMACYSGESLKDRIRRAPLAVEEIAAPFPPSPQHYDESMTLT